MKSIKTLLSIVLTLAATAALAVGPSPAPMKQKEVLTIGYVKVGHLSPMLMLEEELKKLNIEVKRAEFVPYAMHAQPCCLALSMYLQWAQAIWPLWRLKAART